MNHPKPFFNFEGFILSANNIPIKIPMDDIHVKMSKNNQSIDNPNFNSPRKPIIEFIEMINSDVPMAIFMFIFDKITNAGTYKKPPPAPTIPMSVPTTNPKIKIKG